MTNAVELLACPFCGAEPVVDNYGSGACVRIYCKGDCVVYPSVQKYANGDAFEKAAAAWNTRASPAGGDALLSSLRTWIRGLPHDMESRPQVLADIDEALTRSVEPTK